MLNRDSRSPAAGRLIAACLLAILLALISPLAILSELFSLMMVISVPAIGMLLLYRWAGKAPAVLSGMLLLVFTTRLFGTTFMWMAFFTSILPLVLLIRSDGKSFFTRLKLSIAAFCGGTVAAVTVLYMNYGGNIIERVLQQLPAAMRTIPAEALQMPMQTLTAALGREITADGFYTIFDDMIANLIPYYQMNLPGLLFSGALVTAVLCAAIGTGRRQTAGGAAVEGCVPLRDWYLPASTTSGLLTMVVAGYAIQVLGMVQGQTLYYTVYSIATTAFCIQALASMARNLYSGPMRKGAQKAFLIIIAVLCLMGASLYVALYGLASAIFGRRGSLRQKIDNNKFRNNHHSDK